MSESQPDLLDLDELSEDAASRVLQEALDDLDRALSRDPQSASVVRSILEASLTKPLLESTWNGLNERLLTYLESGKAADLFTWISLADTAERLEWASRLGTERVSDLLRVVASIYSKDIERSVNLSNGWVDDWAFVLWRVFFDQVSDGYGVRLDITKENGERFRVEGPPDSLMILTTQVIEMLRAVGTREVFSEDVRRDLLDALENLRSSLQPEAETEATVQP